MGKEPLPRSSVEAYTFFILAYLQQRFGSVTPLIINILLTIVLCGIAVDLAVNSPWTISWEKRAKFALSTFMVIFIVIVNLNSMGTGPGGKQEENIPPQQPTPSASPPAARRAELHPTPTPRTNIKGQEEQSAEKQPIKNASAYLTGQRVTVQQGKVHGSVNDLIKRYPDLNEVIEGLKTCRDLSPEAQPICVKEHAKLEFVAMAMNDPRFTREDIERIMQQSTLSDMEKVKTQIGNIGAVASINSPNHTWFIPPEITWIDVILQKGNTLEKESSEILRHDISPNDFLNNWPKYGQIAKNKNMKMIIRACTKDHKQWLQNQIKFDGKFLNKAMFRNPSDNKIIEGAEWLFN
jgi:hypothetical protein